MLQQPDNTLNISQLAEDDSLFSEEFPYMLWRKRYKGTGEKIMLHYHESIEIIASEGLRGVWDIDGKKFDLSGNTVFVIPPGTLHSATIDPNHGESVILRISIDSMSRYLNVNHISASMGFTFDQLPFTSPFYPLLSEYIKILEEGEEADLFGKLSVFSALFKTLCKPCVAQRNIRLSPFDDSNKKIHNYKIRKIIDWTDHHFEEKIDLTEAAQYLGLSKNYFCKYFKENTGSTYLNYVNRIKIEKASKMLMEGKNVTEVSYGCGFSNISYFIQLFKKTYGVTPAKYTKKLKISPTIPVSKNITLHN